MRVRRNGFVAYAQFYTKHARCLASLLSQKTIFESFLCSVYKVIESHHTEKALPKGADTTPKLVMGHASCVPQTLSNHRIVLSLSCGR
jgi:hypothetical protein